MSVTPPGPPPDDVDLGVVARELLDVVEAQRAVPVEDPGTMEDRITVLPDGTRWLTLGYPEDSAAASAVAWTVQTSMTTSGFDWPAFIGSPRGTLLARRTHEGDLGDATSDECRMLLIALVRQARFCDGAVDDAIGTGFVSTVLRHLIAHHPPQEHDSHPHAPHPHDAPTTTTATASATAQEGHR